MILQRFNHRERFWATCQLVTLTLTNNTHCEWASCIPIWHDLTECQLLKRYSLICLQLSRSMVPVSLIWTLSISWRRGTSHRWAARWRRDTRWSAWSSWRWRRSTARHSSVWWHHSSWRWWHSARRWRDSPGRWRHTSWGRRHSARRRHHPSWWHRRPSWQHKHTIQFKVHTSLIYCLQFCQYSTFNC